MKTGKFTPWNGKPILEQDLPPGVRYIEPITREECLSLNLRKKVWLTQGNNRCCELSSVERGPRQVGTIIDWPDHCGHRPSGEPTWDNIIDMAPSPTALVVWTNAAGHCWMGTAVATYRRGATGPEYTFLGWFEVVDAWPATAPSPDTWTSPARPCLTTTDHQCHRTSGRSDRRMA